MKNLILFLALTAGLLGQTTPANNARISGASWQNGTLQVVNGGTLEITSGATIKADAGSTVTGFGGGGGGNVSANSTVNFSVTSGAGNYTLPFGNGTLVTSISFPLANYVLSGTWNFTNTTTVGNLVFNGTTASGNATFTGNNTFSNVTTFSAAPTGPNVTINATNTQVPNAASVYSYVATTGAWTLLSGNLYYDANPVVVGATTNPGAIAPYKLDFSVVGNMGIDGTYPILMQASSAPSPSGSAGGGNVLNIMATSANLVSAVSFLNSNYGSLGAVGYDGNSGGPVGYSGNMYLASNGNISYANGTITGAAPPVWILQDNRYNTTSGNSSVGLGAAVVLDNTLDNNGIMFFASVANSTTPANVTLEPHFQINYDRQFGGGSGTPEVYWNVSGLTGNIFLLRNPNVNGTVKIQGGRDDNYPAEQSGLELIGGDAAEAIIIRDETSGASYPGSNEYYAYGDTLSANGTHNFWGGGLRAAQTIKFRIANDLNYSAIPLLINTTTNIAGAMLDVNGPAFAQNQTVTGNDTNRLVTHDDLLNYTVPITFNLSANAYIFSLNGTSVPLQVDTTTGNVTGSGNATYSFYGPAAYSSNTGAFKFETSGNDEVNPLYVQSDGQYGYSTINFFTSKNITTNGTNGPLPNGVIATMGAIGGNVTLNQFQPYDGRAFLVGEPAFIAPNFTTPTSGMGELWLGREGIPGLTGNTYTSNQGYLMAQDGSERWVDYNGDTKMMDSATTSVGANTTNRYGGLTGAWEYGANIFFLYGTNAYKGGSSPGNNGGASAGFVAISNSTNAAALIAHTASDTYANEPPGGWQVGGDGNGLIQNNSSSSYIQISIGTQVSNVVENITNASIIANTTTASTSNITGAIIDNGGLGVAGNIYYAGTLNGVSDLGLKDDVQPISEAADAILSLHPISYFRSKAFMASHPHAPIDREIGVSAQELDTLIPEAVTHGSDGNLYVQYDKLIAPTIAAVQQLHQRELFWERAIGVLVVWLLALTFRLHKRTKHLVPVNPSTQTQP